MDISLTLSIFIQMAAYKKWKVQQKVRKNIAGD